MMTRRKVVRARAWNIFPARLCFNGKMLICSGKLWIDVTDKVIRAMQHKREATR